jgi:hypothetical protein
MGMKNRNAEDVPLKNAMQTATNALSQCVEFKGPPKAFVEPMSAWYDRRGHSDRVLTPNV